MRNYQARNFMRDMKVGDLALFYHSNAKPPGVAGIYRVSREAYPDDTQFNKKSKYYDPKSKPEDPRWWLVDIKAERDLTRPVSLPELREIPGLEDMAVIQKGQRLSVQPVTPKEWRVVCKMAKAKTKL